MHMSIGRIDRHSSPRVDRAKCPALRPISIILTLRSRQAKERAFMITWYQKSTNRKPDLHQLCYRSSPHNKQGTCNKKNFVCPDGSKPSSTSSSGSSSLTFALPRKERTSASTILTMSRLLRPRRLCVAGASHRHRNNQTKPRTHL